MIPRMSSGSSRADIAVEPTRSQNITVSCRRSAAGRQAASVGRGATGPARAVGLMANLAARLQGLAEPGSVVVPAATRRLVGDLFRLRGLGRHAVKGLAEPVEA